MDVGREARAPRMDQLVQPIGLLMRPTFTVDLQDSLETVARKMQRRTGLLPATQDGFLAGSVSEEALASAMAAGMELTDPVESLVRVRSPPVHPPRARRPFGFSSLTEPPVWW